MWIRRSLSQTVCVLWPFSLFNVNWSHYPTYASWLLCHWSTPFHRFWILTFLFKCLNFGHFVLLCLSSGHATKIPYTGWLKQQTFISHRPGDWTSRIKAPAGWHLVRNKFLVADGWRLSVPSLGKGVPRALQVSLWPHSWGIHLHDLINSQRSPYLILTHWGLVSISTYGFWGNTNI